MTRPLAAAGRPAAGPRSREAARLHADLAAAPTEVRREFLRGLDEVELQHVLTIAAHESGTPFGLWADDPVGFVEDVLGETLWSKPKEILAATASARRVAVPSCFASSKTWSAARAALWFAFTRPAGHALTVTIAPQWRQVNRQMWPEIRSAHSRAGLPGTIDATQLKLQNKGGLDVVAAYGLAAPPYNETAVQGIHSSSLLLIVDEAGGIGHTIGRNLRGMLTGSRTHMLAIGNPPSDEEEGWFEQLCNSPDVVTIPIRAGDTPNLSGEVAPRCRSCPAEAPVHTMAEHLVDEEWVRETIEEHGEDAPYVRAKVHAEFPSGGSARVLPGAWVDAAAGAEEPGGDGWVRLCDLGVPGVAEEWRVRAGSWVRLGVDVAADGGDELAVACMIGDLLIMRHVSSGAVNANSVDVAGVVLEQIRWAQQIADALGSPAPVRVKVDGIGVGWGVAGLLQRWREEGVHRAEVVAVVVSESPTREPESATLRPYRQRDEMWLAMRALLQPSRDVPEGRVRFRLDRKTLGQLRSPTLSTKAAGGWTVVESKKAMKDRGLQSPDRAEAVLLALFEPGVKRKKRKARVLV